MQMRAEVEFHPGDAMADARTSQRAETHVEGHLRSWGTTRIAGIIKDLSRSGFRIEVEQPLPMDSVVWLKVADLDPLMAQVVWCDGVSSGCRFAAPLSAAAVAAILNAED
jgi:hypothetical protein